MKIALIGATGLVGSALAERLLVEHALIVLTRRPTGFDHPALDERVAPIADWPAALNGAQVDVAISALGTTMRKAGSRAAFEDVDLDAVVAFARAAHVAGARQMIVVSSVGANAVARNFYLRIKGRLERAVGAIGFERVDILRPGLLRGKRGERRWGERIGILVSPIVNLLLLGPLGRYAAIDARLVATAAEKLAGASEPGFHVHDNHAIRALANTR